MTMATQKYAGRGARRQFCRQSRQSPSRGEQLRRSIATWEDAAIRSSAARIEYVGLQFESQRNGSHDSHVTATSLAA
jgi:hypothetical protein